MIIPMRRFLPCLFIALPLLLLAQDPAAPPQKKGGGGAPPKNLKILTPDDLRSGIMRKFTVALGQQCAFCHVPPDMSVDDNPKKEIARHMIAMTKEINAKFPDGKEHVTCFTCHRGANMPLTAPPPAQ
jgi:hypothetical protein